MPALKRLQISSLRNIDSAELCPNLGFNFIYGNNGSGKTSILEAIYLLSHGRSFRTHQQKPLVASNAEHAVVRGESFEGMSIGVERKRSGPIKLKINGKLSQQRAELTRELPVQLLNSDAFNILEGSPKERRAFLDWGVFHVKHQFFDSWRKTKRALLNRNALLKQGAGTKEIDPWTHEFVLHAEELHHQRLEYMLLLLAALDAGSLIEEILSKVLGAQLSLLYKCGWDEEKGLLVQLEQGLEKERRYGHTLYGPHRADLEFSVEGKACSELLSRGQLKILISALKVAQAELLKHAHGRQCLFLVDDLPAELDADNQSLVCSMLASVGSQNFVTAIEETIVARLPDEIKESKLFHVKHGKIST